MDLLVGGNMERMDDAHIDAAEAFQKARADDGKPGESLGETETAELQQTYSDLQTRMKQKPDDAALQARAKAIHGELKKRGALKKSGGSNDPRLLSEYLAKAAKNPVRDDDGEGLEKAQLPSATADITPEKARKILHDGEVQGKPLTDQQRKFFGAIGGHLPAPGKKVKKSMEGLAGLDEVLEKAKYIKRTGSPGNYKYTYPGGTTLESKEGKAPKDKPEAKKPAAPEKKGQGPSAKRVTEVLQSVIENPNPTDMRSAMIAVTAAGRANPEMKSKLKAVVDSLASIEMPAASLKLVKQAAKILSKSFDGSGIGDLDEYLVKAKYTKRTGSPGSYKYTYAKEAKKKPGVTAAEGETSRDLGGGMKITVKQGKTGQWSGTVHGKTGQTLPGASGGTANEALNNTQKLVETTRAKSIKPGMQVTYQGATGEVRSISGDTAKVRFEGQGGDDTIITGRLQPKAAGAELAKVATRGPSKQVATELSRREGATVQDLSAALGAGDYSKAKLDMIQGHAEKMAEDRTNTGGKRLLDATRMALQARGGKMGKSQTQEEDVDALRKSIVGYGGSGGRLGWAERFTGTPFEREALECIKTANAIDKEYDAMYRKYDMPWRERDAMDPVARAKRDKKRNAERKTLRAKEGAERAKKAKVEEKYLDWRIKEAAAREGMHKSMDASNDQQNMENNMSGTNGLDSLTDYLAKAMPGPAGDDSGLPRKYYSTDYPDMPKGSAGLGNMPMDGQGMPKGATNFYGMGAEDGGDLEGVGRTAGTNTSGPGPGQDARGQVSGVNPNAGGIAGYDSAPGPGQDMAGQVTGTQAAMGGQPSKKDSDPGPGQDAKGQVTGVPTTDGAPLSSDDEASAYMAKYGHGGMRKSIQGGNYSQQELEHDSAHQRAAQEQTLRKSLPDVQVVPPHPLQESAFGDVEDRTEALLKSNFYTGGSPMTGRPMAIIDRTVLCKSGCQTQYPAMLTSCPGCGSGTVSHRVVPNQVGMMGEMRLEKGGFNPVLRRPQRTADILIR